MEGEDGLGVAAVIRVVLQRSFGSRRQAFKAAMACSPRVRMRTGAALTAR